MSEKPWREKETLKRPYYGEGMTIPEISEKFDCGTTTVHRWMKRHNIPRRKSGHLKPATFRTESRGYEEWSFKDGDVQRRIRVHQALAIAEYGVNAVAGNIVHHKNGIPWDNRLENLEIMPQDEHAKLHNSGQVA